MEGNLKIKKKDCNCFLLDRVFIVLQKLEGKKTNGLKYKLFDRFPVSKPFMQVSDVEGVSGM